ncbi:MAG: hypothetical protein J5I65_15445 [Aridibacter famidurans]|nr:hypothetical protein [Aridibacter famidurans]
MIEDIEKRNQQLEQEMDEGGIPTEESPLPDVEASPVTSPAPGESPAASPFAEPSLPPPTIN